MKLTILGNNGPFPSAGGACSGYLLNEGSVNILIDCGNGVLSNLQKFARFEELNAIILTHLHSDHVSDMFVLKYAVQIKKKRGQMNRNISVYAPSEPLDEYQRFNVKDAFDLRSISNDLVLNFDKLKVTFGQMKHPVTDYAVSFEAVGKRFVFSGDTSWTDNMKTFGRNADLLMLDAGLKAKDKTDNSVPHLTAEECGIIAREAGAKKLLLTHFWPEYDVNELVEEARKSFQNVEPAKLLQEYEI